MGATLSVRGNGATETIEVKLLVAVVKLEDVTHTLDRLHVLVAVWVHEMKRARLRRVTVGEREVDSEGDVNFAAAEDVLQEGVLTFDLQVLERQLALFLLHLVLSFALLELGESHVGNRVNMLVLAASN